MEKYFEFRPALKESTKKGHQRRFKKLCKNFECKEEEFDADYILSKNIKVMKEFINTISLPSRGSYITTIQFILSPISKNPEEKYKELWEKYRDYFDETELQYRSKDQHKSEKQKANWVEWEEIISLRKKLEKKYNRNKITIRGIRNWSKAEAEEIFIEYQHYVMLCLHTYIDPVRCEYGEMIVCSNKYYTRLIEDEKNYNVYLINDKRTDKCIYFGKFSRKVPMVANLRVPKNNSLPIKLCKVINIFIDLRNKIYGYSTNNETHPFIHKKYRKNAKSFYLMSKNAYSKSFSTFFKKHLGKKIGASMLRNIHTSYYRRGEVPLKTKLEKCEIMNHSLNTQTKTYLKID